MKKRQQSMGVKVVVEKFGRDSAAAAMKKAGEIDYLDYDWGLDETK